jgi:hypothetical protein
MYGRKSVLVYRYRDRLLAARQRGRSSSSAKDQNFLHVVHIGSGANRASFTVGSEALSRGR